MLDPYARSITGEFKRGTELFGYPMGQGDDADLEHNDLDSAPHMPRCVIVDSSFDWAGDQSPRTPMDATIFYEVHVKGHTLNDLVSYNENNGEDNRDDDSHNKWNCGAEGPTEDAAINTLRRRQCRNLMATLFLSQGVPMLCGGDEFGRTQNGNNTYCQDNLLNWFPWNSANEDQNLASFTGRLIAFRHEHPIFRRPKFFTGHKVRGHEFRDLHRVNTQGDLMHAHDWHDSHSRGLGAVLNGAAGDVHDAEGKPVHDDTFMVLFNAHHEPMKFKLAGKAGMAWQLILDTREESGFLQAPSPHAAGTELELQDRSLCVLRLNGRA